MKANELRIGNLVDSPDGICPIIEIDGYSKRAVIHDEEYNDRNGYLLSTLKPIPITEERLVKWGFNKDKSTRNLLFDYTIYFERQGNQLFLCNNQTKVQYLIEWVHEAQNIHFALTGEELETKQ